LEEGEEEEVTGGEDAGGSEGAGGSGATGGGEDLNIRDWQDNDDEAPRRPSGSEGAGAVFIPARRPATRRSVGCSSRPAQAPR
jgi:hypothetical protein